MGVDRIWVAVVALCLACEGETATLSLSRDAAATDSADASGADPSSHADSAAEPEQVDFVHPAMTLDGCSELIADSAYAPSLFAVEGALHAFFTREQGVGEPLEMLVVNPDSRTAGEASTVLHGARTVDLVPDGDGYALLAVRQFYAVWMTSDDAMSWQEQANVAPDEPTYNCEGYPPARFFRGRDGPAHVAMGSDLHDGIFGCRGRLFYGGADGAGWDVPRQVGDGDAVFGFQGQERLMLVSTRGVYLSDDEGATFRILPSGDTTASQVRGSGGAHADGRLMLVQVYNWANANHIVLRVSEDEGRTWNTPLLLDRRDDTNPMPWLTQRGDLIIVVAQSSADLSVTYSPDAGRSWARWARFDPNDGPMAITALPDRLAWLSADGGLELCTASIP